MNLITALILLSALQIYASAKSTTQTISSAKINGLEAADAMLKLENTNPENAKHARMCELLNRHHHIQMCNRSKKDLHTLQLINDYALLQTTNGTLGFIFKDRLASYKAYFDMNMLNTTPAGSWYDRSFNSDYENNISYFANKFDRYRPTRVFHCVGNYRYKGFQDYVKRKPGFEDFLLDLGEQLKPGSAFHKELTKSDNLQDFAALKNMYKAKVRELEQKAQAKHQADLRQNLRARNFNDHGIKLLAHYGITNQFLYAGNSQQMAQLKQIASFMNDVGDFRAEYYTTPELAQIADRAAGFGTLANNANREDLPSASQTFLEIGQNLLALGRGLVAGCERNLTGIYHMVRHPIDTGTAIAGLIKNIGVGIGNAAATLAKNEIGHLLNDPALIGAAQQEMDRYVDSARQIYQYAKKAWQDKSKLERYELVGNLATDLLLAKGLPMVGNLAPIKNLAHHKTQAFAKLGNVGREINQIIGLTCAKDAKAVQHGFEVIKNYPQIVRGQQLLGEAVWHGNKCLNASNKYLRELNKHALKCAIDIEHRLIRIKDKKTFFPCYWGAKMLVNKISEACYNATKIERKWDGTLEIVGFVEEGFQITTRLDKNGRILTAFPDLIKKA